MRDAPYLCAYLVRLGFHPFKIHFLFFYTVQCILARLREQTNAATLAATLRQEVDSEEHGGSSGRAMP